ncbi:unnamed protein product [Dovyalis caffra]|uniref:Uncharacterized protein n=1 Tax=Dovyalis caffra TaxID=77055 RepID=A0AAV1RH18_9ROSI|nr:unnamed protein product [Dovyalis caffra]
MRATLLSLLGDVEKAPLCGVENLEFVLLSDREKKLEAFSLPNLDNSRKSVPIVAEVPFATVSNKADEPVPASSLEVAEEPRSTSYAVEIYVCKGFSQEMSAGAFSDKASLLSRTYFDLELDGTKRVDLLFSDRSCVANRRVMSVSVESALSNLSQIHLSPEIAH